MADGRVLVIAGSDARDDLGLYDSAETYDPTTDAFTAVGRLAHPRYKLRYASVLLPDGRVLSAGGAAVPEVFDPAVDAFTSIDGSFGRAPTSPQQWSSTTATSSWRAVTRIAGLRPMGPG